MELTDVQPGVIISRHTILRVNWETERRTFTLHIDADGTASVEGDYDPEFAALMFWNTLHDCITKRPDDPAVAVFAYKFNDTILIELMPDASIRYGDNYRPDELAREFWETVLSNWPQRLRLQHVLHLDTIAC